MRFTRHLSYSHLLALVLALSGMIFFVVAGYMAVSGATFAKFIIGIHEEQDLNRIPEMFATGMNELVQRKAQGMWQKVNDGTFSQAHLASPSLIEALWIVNPDAHCLQIMTASQCFSLPLNASGAWTTLLSEATSLKTPAKTAQKKEDFVVSRSFTRLDRYRLSDVSNAPFCVSEMEYGTDAPMIRGALFRTSVLFENFIFKQVNLHCDSNRIALELLAPDNCRVFLSKGGVAFHGPFEKGMIGADAELFSPPLTGLLANYRFKISYPSNWGDLFIPSFAGMPRGVIPLMALILAGSVVYFYMKTKSGEEELRLQNDWVANLAHSMRGPVHSLGVLTEAFIASPAELQAPLAKLIQGELDEMDKTYRQFIRLSRVGMNRLVLNIEPVNLLEIVNNIQSRLLPRYPAFTAGNFTVEGAAGLFLKGDPTAVSEVVEAALDNALKYSPQGTPIHLVCHNQQGTVCIKVVDQGIGIPKADLAQVGEPFFRATQENSDGIVGTGLGVYLARILCEKMGGQYTVSSQGTGKGCLVVITLPEARP